MPLKQCFYEMNITFHLEKNDTIYKFTAFPRVISTFLCKDMYRYKKDTDTLIERILPMENVDFEVSPNQKLVTNMNIYAQIELTGEQLLECHPGSI